MSKWRRTGNAELQRPLSLHVARTMQRAAQAGEIFLTKSKLFVATIAVTAAIATPAFAQWRSPSAVDRNPASPETCNTTANAPSATSPRPTVIRATRGQ